MNSACILLESQGILALKKGKDLTGDKVNRHFCFSTPP